MKSSPLSLQERETIKKICLAHRIVAGGLIFVAVLMTGICVLLACHLPDDDPSVPVFAYLLLILFILCAPILSWWLAVWGIKRISPFTRALKANETNMTAF